MGKKTERKVITIRVTKAQKEAIAAAASKTGKSIALWLREQALQFLE